MKDVIEEELTDEVDYRKQETFSALLIRQFMNGCLCEVNWDEIAAHFIDSASYDFKNSSAT